MPELPDVIVYVDALKSRIAGRRLLLVRLHSPFVLRSVEPPLDLVGGQIVRDVRRVGKRIVLECDDPSSGSGSVFLVIHLMIAGRLRWRDRDQTLGVGPKIVLATFAFDHGTVVFTEAGSKKRASIQMVRGEAALGAIDPGGIEPLDASLEQFRNALTREQHTLKRALTDPHLFSGIGNAYSDEILHAARLSPLKLSRALAVEEMRRLHDATRSTLASWIARLRQEAANGFPEKVTAFHEGMAVHGRFKKPCPVCGSPVQRIVYAENECNYCATCQTGGRLLADRSLSRLLKDDWPRRLDGQ
ncbi:MAG: formamidopyrimidine-DNA glycosylase [Acidobacteria bacterium RIFCSPLOWO2_02_FULL_65_29]|nr:MAG: formamidopyrimidine-DNA glycosylase [Acidobacteria bacterium RIFCSPLOWO2_02_FULL_65_29]